MLDIKELYLKDYIDQEITVSGWIKNHRKQAHFGFIDLSDGTYFKGLQVVYDDNLKDFEEVTGYPNLSISEGKVYDGNNLDRADGKEYIFVKTTDEIYINLYEIKNNTTANEYTIPENSI